MRAAGRKTSFKDGLCGLQQFGCSLKGSAEPFGLNINQRTCTVGIIDALGDVPDLVPDLKACLGGSGIIAQVRAMDFQPQALGALAQGQKLGF